MTVQFPRFEYAYNLIIFIINYWDPTFFLERKKYWFRSQFNELLSHLTGFLFQFMNWQQILTILSQVSFKIFQILSNTL